MTTKIFPPKNQKKKRKAQALSPQIIKNYNTTPDNSN
jgi:hypothetical protein